MSSSGKRQATTYLTREPNADDLKYNSGRGGDDDDDDAGPDGAGIDAVAPDEELKTRKFIKAKRSANPAAAAAAATAFPAASGASPFAGINLSTSSTASPFANISLVAPAASAPSASPFAGISLATTPAPAIAAPAPAAKAEVATDFYLQIRGLNESFVSHAKAAVAKDPYTDLSTTFKQYEEYRKGIQAKLNDAEETKPSAAAPVVAPTPVFSLSKPLDVQTPSPVFSLSKPLDVQQTPSPVAADKPAVPSLTDKPPVFAGFGGLSQPGLFTLNGSSGSGLFGGLSNFTSTPSPLSSVDGGEDDNEKFPEEARTNSELIKVGEGEEKDEALFTIEKCKIHKMAMSDADKKWIDVGTGILKLNSNTEHNFKRLLARAEGSGIVLLNTRLIKDVNAKADVSNPQKPTVSFFSIDENAKLVKYNVRVKSADIANDFAKAIESNKPL